MLPLPWPATIPGLGELTIAALEHCADCSASSWARYGTVPLCLACAKRRLAEGSIGRRAS